jgi:choline dehydrogenase
VEPAPDPHPIAHAFLQGTAAYGIATFDDQNGVLLEGDGGAAIANVRIRDGRRRNIPADYLNPVMHQPNLTVLISGTYPRIIENRRCAGDDRETTSHECRPENQFKSWDDDYAST